MKKNIFYFILGAIIFSGITVFAETIIQSSYITYDNTSSGLPATNVKGAIDYLYTLAAPAESTIAQSTYDFEYTSKVSSNKVVINITDNDNFNAYFCGISSGTFTEATDGKCVVDNLDEETSYYITTIGIDNTMHARKKNITAQTGTSLVMDNTYLSSGSTNGNVTITSNNPDSTYGLSITGSSPLSVSATQSGGSAAQIQNGNMRWYKEIDLTNYNELTFYAKKGQDHGKIMIGVDGTYLLEKSYTNLDTNWNFYTVDLSNYTGSHVLSIMGGYSDSSGNSSSNTQYYDIELH